MGHVRLEAVPEGLRPGMSAEVEITTSVPASDDPGRGAGRRGAENVCYVRGEEGLERREVKLGKATATSSRWSRARGGRGGGDRPANGSTPRPRWSPRPCCRRVGGRTAGGGRRDELASVGSLKSSTMT